MKFSSQQPAQFHPTFTLSTSRRRRAGCGQVQVGPPPKKISAKAIVATASGNSNPPSHINPWCQWTFQMATPRSMHMAKATRRVKSPARIIRPPKNSVKEDKIGRPGRQSEAGNKLSVMMKSAEDL